MNYTLHQEDEHIRLEIQQEDDRAGAQQEAPQGEENPVLKGLKSLAKS